MKKFNLFKNKFMKITWLILDPSMSPTTLLWALTPSPSSSTENSSSLE